VSAVEGWSRQPKTFSTILTRVVGLKPKTIEAEAGKNVEAEVKATIF